MAERFKIVCISGSMRFFNQMIEEAVRLTLERYIVVMPFVNRRDDLQLTDADLKMLEDMHYQKIFIADVLLVVNPGGYIGESTQKEIDYAYNAVKTIWFIWPMSMADGEKYAIQNEIIEAGFSEEFLTNRVIAIQAEIDRRDEETRQNVIIMADEPQSLMKDEEG